jgi:DNA-binding transcriptional regulator LsrR (DeoR family)
MPDNESRKLLYKVARAYHEDNLTQEQIGQRFGLSRIKISRLLSQARQEKIVQVTIVPPPEGHAELERAIETRYGLDEVLIAYPADDTPSAILSALGETAAHCLMRTLRGEEVVAFTWGNTLLAMVDALQSATGAPIRDWPGLRVVQSLGGLGSPEADVYSAGLVHRMARTLGARHRLLAAPGIVSTAEVRDALLADPHIASTIALAAKADIALMGLGRPAPGSAVMQSSILSADEFTRLQSLGAVGDIGLRFFDAEGRPVAHEINDRIIGLSLDQIKAIPRVIGVAGGEEKFEVIRAALRGRLIKVLITDHLNAEKLLAENNSDPT